jgi:glycosyltransferase involved in cell wall biosynthesis
MKKISIIIPVYNVEKYLKRCLDSIVNQTLKDIEIICIDDGSTDNSLAILNDYAQRDSRVKVLHQENAKQGAARNRGLEIATGEFVTFVDSDDWVELDYCELLYNAAIKHNVNIAAASATRDYEHKVKTHLMLTQEETFYGANDIVKGLKRHLETALKLYKFEPIKDLRFEENVLYEDAPYSLQAICLAGSMVTVPEAHYHYFSNPTSTIKQNSTKNNKDKITTSLSLLKIAEDNNVDIGEWAIIKERHLLWSVKHYKDYKDFYICGLKVARKNIKFENPAQYL